MAKISDYIDKVGKQAVAIKPLNILIPKQNIDSGVATMIDDKIHTFGIFEFESTDGKDRFACNYPLELILNIFDMDKDEDYFILKYDTDDVIIESMGFIPNAKRANGFMNFLTQGKIVASSKEDLVDIFRNNMTMNGVSMNVASEIVEAMISEMIRYKKDLAMPFRLVEEQPGVQPDDFSLINIKDIARLSSVFGAISFEDVKKALQAGVYITRTGQEQFVPPTESVLKY